MKKKKVLFLTLGAILLLIIVASATSQYWGKLSFKTQNIKGTFFKINLLGEPAATYELTPGDSFTIEPVIRNIGTEPILCFITIKCVVGQTMLQPSHCPFLIQNLGDL